MNSMTGFGSGQAEGQGLRLNLELASVNRRGLETGFSSPKEWQTFERLIFDAIRKRFQRGKIQATLTVETSPSSNALQWDNAALNASLDQLQSFAQARGITFIVDPETLLKLALLHKTSGEVTQLSDAQPLFESALATAITSLAAMRATEGQALAADLASRLQRLSELLDGIRQDSAGTVQHYREVLFERLQNAGLELDLNDERVLREIALFADRCDISEEITRLDSHLQQFSQLIADSQQGGATAEAIGRKLEFLLQEIHREFNTIGSKANNIAISKHVLEAKNELERLREQAANVE